MSPKSFVQFNSIQEGTEILWVQLICLQTDTETNRPGPRGDSTIGGSPKNQRHHMIVAHITEQPPGYRG